MLGGASLFETLMLNMVPYDAVEANLPSDAAKSDTTAWENGVLDRYDQSRPRGYADRYTWQSRLVRVREDGGAVGPTVTVTQGLVMEGEEGLPLHLRDPMFYYKVSEDKKRVFVWDLEEDRASWRDLHSLLATWPKSRGGNRPPLALCFVTSMADEVGPEAQCARIRYPRVWHRERSSEGNLLATRENERVVRHDA